MKMPDARGTYCMIPLTRNVQRRQVHRNGMYVSSCPGLWQEKNGEELLIMGHGFIREMKRPKVACVHGWLPNFVDILKIVELDTNGEFYGI